MKDLKLGNLEDVYGTLMDEILCEVFECEEQINQIHEDFIYELSSEKEIQKRIEREAISLNEGCAEIDDLTKLEKQAMDYFKNPTVVYVPKEEPVRDYITIYIQFSAGMNFDSNGNAVPIWKSFGQKLVVDTEKLYAPENLLSHVESLGIEVTDLVRLVCYGPSLEKLVGSKLYKKGERKELVELDESYPNIMLSIPDEGEVNYSDDSIFSRVESIVNESIKYGMDVSVDKAALLHWQLTHTRLDEIKLEQAEEKESLRIQRLQRKSVERRNDFDDNFREAREVIKGLNSGELSIKSILNSDLKLLNQVMYLTQKKGERINRPAVYFQLRSLISNKKLIKMEGSSDDQKSLELIKLINSGGAVEVHLLSYEELDSVFKVLWGNVGVRILGKYKETYFLLKERFAFLKSIQGKDAA